MKKFHDTGRIICTRLITERSKDDYTFKQWINECLLRYFVCDWGDLGTDDKKMNDTGITSGDRILAKYKNLSGDIFIITEADRSYTTILFTEEY